MACCQDSFPPMPTRLCNALRAAVQHVAVDGLTLLPQADIDARASICGPCEYRDLPTSKCRVCGCWVGYELSHFNKLAHPSQSCPDGRW